MEPSPSPSAIVGLVALILIFFTSIPTFLLLFKRVTSKARGNLPDETSRLYEDEDGIATKETQEAYSAAVPKYTALLCSLLGFAASTSIAILTTAHPTLNSYVEHWLSFGTWVWMFSKRILSTN